MERLSYHQRQAYQRKLAEIQAEAQRERDLQYRMTAQLEKRLGMPSPRLRAMAADRPPVIERGPNEQVTISRAVYHSIPHGALDHTKQRSCWCMPTETLEDGAIFISHNAVGRFEEGNDNPQPDWLTSIQRRDG